MSILRSLLRFVDPIQHRIKQAEERRKVSTVAPAEKPDQPPAAAGICRVCRWQGAGEYCMRCLAATMEKKR